MIQLIFLVFARLWIVEPSKRYPSAKDVANITTVESSVSREMIADSIVLVTGVITERASHLSHH
jgi:hypothetical protein